MNLKRIRKTIMRDIQCELDGLSLKDGVQWLINHQNEFGEDAKFTIDYEYDEPRLVIAWTVLETDAEYGKRLRVAKKAKETRRKTYEKLKREFERREKL